MKKHGIHNVVLFGAIMLMLMLPFIQQAFKPIELEPLHGAIVKAEAPETSFSNWLDESFQQQTEKYLNDHFGFRSLLVRINNEFVYRLFKVTRAKSVTLGKSGYLYENGYIDAYYGNDYIGRDNIKKNLDQLETLQDTLSKYNTKLLVVLAPGKGSFYPEFIPDELIAAKDTTNFEMYIRHLQHSTLDYLDLNSWFKQMKDTSKHMLYPKTGIHWSYYGMELALDTIIKRLEVSLDINMPKYSWNEVELKSSLNTLDYDIERGLNLLLPISKKKMAYPKTVFHADGKTKPKAIIVSDSFYWGIHGRGDSKKIFDNGSFWYYNKAVYPAVKSNRVKNLNVKQELIEQDVIILMSTDANLKKFDWGFAENALKSFAAKDI